MITYIGNYSFLQGVALEIMAFIGIIGFDHFLLDAEHICEIVLFSIVHCYAFMWAPYGGDVAENIGMAKKIKLVILLYLRNCT